MAVNRRFGGPGIRRSYARFVGPGAGGAAAPSYLLDQYPGAAAAYSTRRLSSTYAGSAIRVRRSSDDAEADIGFTSTGDLDTAALLAHVGASDGFVRTLYDQSGNGRDREQPTAVAQPRIASSGVVDVVGTGLRPAPYAHSLAYLYLPCSTSYSAEDFMGVGFLEPASAGSIIPLAGTTASDLALVAQSGSGSFSIVGGAYAGASVEVDLAGTLATRGQIYAALTDPTTHTWQVYGTTATTGHSPYSYSSGWRLPLGSSDCEFVAYTSDQSANRAAIVANQQAYWV